MTPAEPVPADLDALRAGTDIARQEVAMLRAELEGARQKVADAEAASAEAWRLGEEAIVSLAVKGSDLLVRAEAAEAEAAALRTALGEFVTAYDESMESPVLSVAADRAWDRINDAADVARAALAGARPEATEGADDPVRRSSTRPEEGP